MDENKRDKYKKYNKQILVAILITLIPFAYMIGYQTGSNDVHDDEEIEYNVVTGMVLGILFSEIIIFIYLNGKYDDFNEPFEMIEWFEEHNELDDVILELIAERKDSTRIYDVESDEDN